MKKALFITILVFLLLAVPILGANSHSATFVAGSSQCKDTTADFTDFGTDAVTVEAWVKTSTDNGTTQVVAMNNAVSATFQMIKISSLGYRFEVGLADAGDEISDYIAEGSIEDGTWHHLAGSYDGANMHIYLDGVEQGTENAESGNIRTNQPAHLAISCDEGGGTPRLFWNGQIDDVRIWDIARTEAQINDNKCVELTGSEPGLTLYAKLNNNNTDATGNYTIQDINSPTFTTDHPACFPEAAAVRRTIQTQLE